MLNACRAATVCVCTFVWDNIICIEKKKPPNKRTNQEQQPTQTINNNTLDDITHSCAIENRPLWKPFFRRRRLFSSFICYFGLNVTRWVSFSFRLLHLYYNPQTSHIHQNAYKSTRSMIQLDRQRSEWVCEGVRGYESIWQTHRTHIIYMEIHGDTLI